MNYTFIFFLCALAILILSTVSICTAPIINGILEFTYLNKDCKYYTDQYDNYEKVHPNPNDVEKIELAKQKKIINICKREKAMHGLEYGSLVSDVAFGGICAILGLLHYLEIGKTFEKKTGLIGIIGGTIGFLLTFIYIIFSGYIFNNDTSENIKLFPNKAYLKWNGYKYVSPYDQNKYEDNKEKEKNPFYNYATYSELGQKQYNYDSEFYKFTEDNNNQDYYSFCKEINYNGINDQKISESGSIKCDYIWSNNIDEFGQVKNKYIYDRWITTIILSVFTDVLSIVLILFGFFLFKNLGDSNSGAIPIPMSSVNALENK